MTPCFVTAIYGDFDSPKAPPTGCRRAVMFTDRPTSASGWEVRVDTRYAHLHPRMQAKAPKLQPHVFLPDEPFTVWVDGSMNVSGEAAEIPHAGLRFFRHPDRWEVLPEALVSQRMGKYAGLPVLEQANHYLTQGLLRGLWASGFHMRDIREPRVVEFFDAWWRECLLWTYQDQISLPYARQTTGVEICDIPGVLWSNPYFSISGHNRGD